MKFMNSILDVLVKNLSDTDFKHLSQEFSDDLFKLVKQKGVYPYDKMESLKKFFDKQLPDRSNFFNSLKDESIGEKNYLYVIDVWNMLKNKNYG